MDTLFSRIAACNYDPEIDYEDMQEKYINELYKKPENIAIRKNADDARSQLEAAKNLWELNPSNETRNNYYKAIDNVNKYERPLDSLQYLELNAREPWNFPVELLQDELEQRRKNRKY